MSSYHLITFWIAFGVIFVWMIIYRIVDCWLKRQYIKSFYRFCQTVRGNSPPIWNICFLSWCIDRDGGLNASVRSHDIGVTFGISFFLFRLCIDFSDYLLKFLISEWYLVMIIMLYYSFSWMAMHARSYVMSSLFKISLPHLNMLKQLSKNSSYSAKNEAEYD